MKPLLLTRVGRWGVGLDANAVTGVDEPSPAARIVSLAGLLDQTEADGHRLRIDDTDILTGPALEVREVADHDIEPWPALLSGTAGLLGALGILKNTADSEQITLVLDPRRVLQLAPEVRR